MGRLIDADRLMGWFKEHNPFDEFPAEYICGIINEQPTVPRWRPVSEMPEEKMWTICQNNAGAMMIGKYDIEFGWMFPAYFDGIVAWQPCPAPYKVGEK